ncbi:amino acid adenylation domain-containing protein [Salmonella enterica subsp. enterica serovar Java]|nr:amino acid adenylation domain-containing protein [Salmonella enterica subsp. enterica serovar Java]EGZ6416373.1 amino acid adenylation domain-containing protein [Salmonella enterica subsp. enterica serovar Java]
MQELESVKKFLDRLNALGCHIWHEQGELHYRAPKGVMAPEIIGQLKELKEVIIEWLVKEEKRHQWITDESNRYEPFPLSDVQFAYLLGRNEAFGYGGVGCHLYLEVDYSRLDESRVKDIWNKLVIRHEMLRAVFDMRGSQRIIDVVPDLVIECKKGINSSSFEFIRNEYEQKLGHKIYEPDVWPLFDVALTQGPDSTVLHLSLDFLIADWASVRLLLAEFEMLYFNHDNTLNPPEFTLSFRDYMFAVRRLREGTEWLRDRQYWQERLEQIAPAPQLPLRPVQAQTVHFTRHVARLGSDDWSKFKYHSAKAGLTPTVAVMTAYAAVLARWSSEKIFTLNLTVLNRFPLHPQIEQIVGDFTSVSLLSLNWSVIENFREHAMSLSRQLFDDLDHRFYSGVEVLRDLNRLRGGNAILMPIVFTSAIGLGNRDVPLRGIISGRGITQTPQVFIDCQAMDDSNGLHINWDVRDGVFPDGMIDDMMTAFQELLTSLATNENRWQQPAKFNLPDWQQQMVRQMNNTLATLPEGELYSRFIDKVLREPDAVAIIDSAGAMSYSELFDMARKFAWLLLERDCQQGERVAIRMYKGSTQVAAVLGVMFCGGVYVPVDWSQPNERRNVILDDAKIRLMLTDRENTDLPDDVVEISSVLLETAGRMKNISFSEPENVAYVIYTSGSTGLPKGVVISHQAALNTVLDINKRYSVSASDTILGLAQLGFDLSVYDIFGLLSAGGKIVYPEPERQRDPSHWAALIKQHHVTIWNSVPAQMQMLEEYLKMDFSGSLSSLRVALLSGDWVPSGLPDAVCERWPEIQLAVLGGATEAAIWSICHDYNGKVLYTESIPYGKPLNNQRFYVLDRHMMMCPVWARGELYIGGAGLASAYLGDPDKTQQHFISHPESAERLYRTGDAGRYLPHGEIEFLGRVDNQIKIRGYRIEPGEIENTLTGFPGVKAAGVVLSNKSGGNKLLAVVQGNNIVLSELRVYLSERLPGYMVPSYILLTDHLPLTSNGKIDRKALTNWECETPSDNIVYHEVQDALHKKIKEMWQDSLDITELNMSDNLHDLGADSLVIASMAGRIRKEIESASSISFDVLVRYMLNYPQVGELVDFIRGSVPDGNFNLDKVKEEKQIIENGMQFDFGVLTRYGGGDTEILRVIFHAGLGTMDCFRPLIRELDNQQKGRVVGITIKDGERYCALPSKQVIDTLAEEYTKHIISQGCTHIQLIGYCLGGLYAIEVARRLTEQGVDVSDLVLISSHPILIEVEDDMLIELLFIPNLHINLQQTGFSDLHIDNIIDVLVNIFSKNNGRLPAGALQQTEGAVHALFSLMGSYTREQRFEKYIEAVKRETGQELPFEMALNMFNVFRQSFFAANYYPAPYVGNICFLLPEESSGFAPHMDESTLDYWRDICLGELEIIPIKGNHFSCIEDGNVSGVATFLEEKITKGR